MKQTKTKIVFLMLSMLILSIVSAMTVMGASGKPVAIAYCTQAQMDNNTGICADTSPFIKVRSEENMSCGSGVYWGWCSWILNKFAPDQKLLAVSMGQTDTMPQIEDRCGYGCYDEGYFDWIGKVKAHTNNATAIQIDTIEGVSVNHEINYSSEQTVLYTQLNFTYELQNVTEWNGTANVTTEKNVSFIEDFITFDTNEITVDVTIVPSADGSATVTFDTGMINSTPPVIQKDGMDCNSGCENLTYDMSTGELSFHTDNFSTFTTSSNSNIFAVYEPTSSCTSSSGVFYYGCTGRYGQAIDFESICPAGVCNFSGEFWTVCSWSSNAMGCGGSTKYLFSGSNSWFVSMDAFFDTGYCVDVEACSLGRIKGQSHHNALITGNTTTGLVIDSPYGTVTFDAGSEINMSEVLDMSIDSLIANDPFRLANELITVDSVNYPGMNKAANIKFKGVINSNAQIYLEGAPCPNDVCTNTDFDHEAQTLSTDVTGFSTFTLGFPSTGGSGGSMPSSTETFEAVPLAVAPTATQAGFLQRTMEKLGLTKGWKGVALAVAPGEGETKNPFEGIMNWFRNMFRTGQ